MTSFPLWAEQLFNQPVALSRMKNETLCEFANLRVTGTKPAKIDVAALEGVQMRAMSDDATYYSDEGRKPFLFRGNIAVVPVRGTLVQRGNWMDAESGLVGYNAVLRQIRAAAQDNEIGGIFMPIHSGGGSCAGMLAAAEEIASLAKAEGGKPIHAYIDEQACSAAYVLISGCDRISGRAECMGGSIAALLNMLDTSKAYEKAGLRPVVIRAGWADRKARGQLGEEIDEKLIAEMTALVDHMSGKLVEFVAAMRGLPEAKIKSLKGEVFHGEDLLKLGLIDAIASERAAWAALEADIAAA